MKKVALAIVAVLMIANSYAQEFMGVKVGGTPAEVIKKMTEKGFTLEKKNPDNSQLTMKGKVGNEEIEFLAAFTPTSKVCWKFIVYFEEQNDWYSLKAKYTQKLNMLKEKYGEPTNDFSFFSKPYYEGDGYEMTAVRIEKAHYSAFWANMSIEISKYKQVCIGYENPDNVAKKNDETSKLNQSAF